METKKTRFGRPLQGLAIYGLAVAFFFNGPGRAVWPQWLGWGLGLVGLFSWGRTRNPKVGVFFAVCLGTSLLFTGWESCPSRLGPASNFDFISRCGVLAALKERTDLSRVLIGDKIPYPIQTGGKVLQGELPPNAAMVSGLRNAMGYNPLNLEKVTDLYTLPPRTFARLMALGSYVSGDPRWKIPGFSKRDWGPVQYGRNQEPVSFAYSPGQVAVVTDDEQRLGLMRQPGFNPYDTAYFSDPIPNTPQNTGQPGAGEPFVKSLFQFKLTKEGPDEELFQVRQGRSGWVVFSEVMYPGWKAWLDGNPAPLLTANHIFRSLWVPAGNHEVRFRYEPRWWKPILAGTGLWLLSLLGWFLGPAGKILFREFQKI